jgi:hypothetical protein
MVAEADAIVGRKASITEGLRLCAGGGDADGDDDDDDKAAGVGDARDCSKPGNAAIEAATWVLM